MATEELIALREELKRLRAENEEFRSKMRPVTFSVNERGAIAVHGISKNPQCLYKVQWERIIEKADEMKTFIEQHADELR